MGKNRGVILGKGCKKIDRKAINKLPKGAKKLLQGALKGGAGGSWVTALVSSKKGPTIAEQQAVKKQKNPSGPAQTAHYFFTKTWGLADAKTSQKTLLVGEGNFSFARALIEELGGLGSQVTATAFDSEKTLSKKYTDAADNISFVASSGAAILYDIDGTKLEEHTALDKPFDLIIFNFPHVGLGIKDQNDNIQANAELVGEFLESAASMVSSRGLICVTVKRGEPYDSWRVPRLGLKVSTLRLKNTVPFDPVSFPGYAHRRTAGETADETGGSDNDIMSNGAHTYMFTPAEIKTKERGKPGKAKKKAKGGGSKPGGFNPKGGASKALGK